MAAKSCTVSISRLRALIMAWCVRTASVISDAIWRMGRKILRDQEDGAGRFGGKLGEKRAAAVMKHTLPKVDSLGYIFVRDSLELTSSTLT